MKSIFQRAGAALLVLPLAIFQSPMHAFTVPSRQPLKVSSNRISNSSQQNVYNLQMGLRAPFSTQKRQFNEIKRTKTHLFQRVFGVRRFIQRFRRSMTILCTVSMIFFGTSVVLPQSQVVAHASTTILTKQKNLQRSLDRIIHEYIQENMFNDDEFDPLESAYRETMHDSITGEYPNLLSNTASSALGKKGITSPTSALSIGKNDLGAEGKIIKTVIKTVDSLHLKTGVPKAVLNFVLVGGGVCTSIIGLCLGLMGFSTSQRAMTEKLAIERYGESVLSAEEVVPEEDDDEYESGNFDDDDDVSTEHYFVQIVLLTSFPHGFLF